MPLYLSFVCVKQNLHKPKANGYENVLSCTVWTVLAQSDFRFLKRFSFWEKWTLHSKRTDCFHHICSIKIGCAMPNSIFLMSLHNAGNILLIFSCSIWYTVSWKDSLWEKLTLKWKRTNCLHDRYSIYIGCVMSNPMFLTVYKTEKIFCHLFRFNQIFGFLKLFIFMKMSVKVEANSSIYVGCVMPN